MDLSALWAAYFTSLDIDNSLSELHVELWPWLQMCFFKPPTKKFFFFKCLNLSTGLLQRRLPLNIAVRWWYRLPINNLKHITTVSFVSAFIFVLSRKPEKASKHVGIG